MYDWNLELFALLIAALIVAGWVGVLGLGLWGVVLSPFSGTPAAGLMPGL